MFAAKNELLTPSSTGYRISRSLRFRSSASAYLSRTPASSGNRQTWTWSAWVKRGTLGISNTFFTAGYNTAPWFIAQFQADSAIQISVFAGSSNGLITNAVFRDPSAFYHIVITFDATQATASNRLKLYVNSVQQTFSNSNYPAQNTNYQVNNTVSHTIGGYSGEYFDGYLAEVNFIDGQALTPSSFGANDPVTGVWGPKKYTGSYSGTNSFYLPFSATATSSYTGNFSGSNYLNAGTQTALQLTSSTAFTIEGWVNFDAVSAQQYLLSNWVAGGAGYALATGVSGYATNQLCFYDGATWRPLTQTVSANTWYHFAISSSGSASGTYCYLNGVSQTSGFSTNAAINNTTSVFYLGSYANSTTAALTGKLSNIRVVKGSNLYPNGTSFSPSVSPLSVVTNTQLLTLQNSSIVDNSPNALTITNTGSVTTSAATPWSNYIAGQDSSGAGNNWASANINVTSSGTTYDSMIDTPTPYADGGNGRGNYCVINPVGYYGGYATITNGNTRFTSTNSNWLRCVGTIPVSSGKWYWEITVNNASEQIHGAQTTITPTFYSGATNWIGYDAGGYGYYSSNGNKYNSNVAVAYGSSYTTNDVIGVALDLDNGAIYFGKQTGGTGSMVWQNSGVPTSGSSVTGAAYTGLSGTFVPAFALTTVGPATNTCDVNFGQRPFSATIPSGYSALNTQNLPTPTIKNGSAHMNVALDTGANIKTTSQALYTYYLEWIKDRANANNNQLADTVRGNTAILQSNTTAAETTYTAPTGNSVGWVWNASQASVSNTSGSITSTVSANTSAGFSVVAYTGTGANATVGHGLGVAPSMIITKWRGGANNWAVGHANLTNWNWYLVLNGTAAQAGDATVFPANPTSSVFSVGTNALTNGSTNGYVAYCFAAVAGYSAFGSYTGNGSTDGPFVYTGFRPRWVMYKRTDAAGYNWTIQDTSTSSYNVNSNYLQPNTSNAEASAGILDFTSNGIKVRNSDVSVNASGGTYIYAAFAEVPFKFSLGR